MAQRRRVSGLSLREPPLAVTPCENIDVDQCISDTNEVCKQPGDLADDPFPTPDTTMNANRHLYGCMSVVDHVVDCDDTSPEGIRSRLETAVNLLGILFNDAC